MHVMEPNEVTIESQLMESMLSMDSKLTFYKQPQTGLILDDFSMLIPIYSWDWSVYRIRPNIRGTQFSRIALSKQFAVTIFADQELRVYWYSKISRPRKFGRIR